MRLTHLCKFSDNRKNREPLTKIRNKLFELENIEDELGIDLRVLFNVFKQSHIVKKEKAGAYLEVVYETGEYIYPNINTNYLLLDIKNKCLVLFDEGNNLCEDEDKLYFKDYGKTWALDEKGLL